MAIVDARGARTERSYDAVGRLVASRSTDGGTTNYGYCAVLPGSSPCQVVDPMGRVTTITFDALGREATQADAVGDTTTTTHDKVGRTSSVTGPGPAPEGDEVYYGITNDPERWLRKHRRLGKSPFRRMVVLTPALPRGVALATETRFIHQAEADGRQVFNIVKNPVGSKPYRPVGRTRYIVLQ